MGERDLPVGTASGERIRQYVGGGETESKARHLPEKPNDEPYVSFYSERYRDFWKCLFGQTTEPIIPVLRCLAPRISNPSSHRRLEVRFYHPPPPFLISIIRRKIQHKIRATDLVLPGTNQDSCRIQESV